jgi:hypothetical protein
VLPIADQSGAQAPAGRTGSAGAFAPSGPAWLNRASGSQSAVAGSPSWPKSRRAGAPASHSGPGHRASRSDETPVLAEPRGGGGEHARRSFAGRRRWIPVAAAVVLLIACGAGAAFLLSRNTPAGKPSAAASRPGGAGHTTPTPATTTPPSSLVITVVPAVADRPSAPAVAAFLSRYFTAINNHDFAAYKHLFSRPLRRTLSRRDFRHGYGSSVDSGATLHRIRLLGGREIAAVVTFTSHQHRAASPRNSACDVWKISLYLVPRGGGYAIVTPPASYQPAVHSCSGT